MPAFTLRHESNLFEAIENSYEQLTGFVRETENEIKGLESVAFDDRALTRAVHADERSKT